MLCLWLLIPGLVPTAEAIPSKRERWIEVRTDHFILFSNVSAGATRRIGHKLEALRAVLSETTQGLRVHSPLPTSIYVFRNDRSFRPYKTGEGGAPRNVSGYFVSTHDGNYVAVDASADAGSLGVVYHEYLHYFVENNIPNTPLWLNEGLAELYSTFRSREREADVGLPIQAHVDWLRRNPLLPFERFFAVNTHSPEYNEAQRQGTFYAQSWALMHYLMMGVGDQGKLADYLWRVNHGEEPLGAFEQVYDLSAEELARVLERYVARPLDDFRSTTVRLRGRLDPDKAEVRSLERSETLFRLGDLLAHHPPIQFGAAEEHLRAARAIDPSAPGPLLTLAHLREQEERYPEAVELYREAIKADGSEPSPYARCGWALIEQFVRDLPDRPRFAATPPPLREARRLFRSSLELDKDNAESLAGFARTFLFEQSVSGEALKAAERASMLLPSRDDILHDRIVLLAVSGDTAAARELFVSALRRRSDDEELIRSAESSLVQAEIAEAVAWMNEGRSEEATCRLEQIAAATSNTGLRKDVEAQMASMADLARANLQISMFNRAAEHAGRGDLDLAVRELDRLLEVVRDPQLRERALTAREEFLRVERHNEAVSLYNTAVDMVKVRRFGEARSLLRRVLEQEPEDSLKQQAQTLLGQLGDRR
ncbi:hypothetical protein ABI59_11925 [Acidobacteria bacterium Mor1]|nr:hypothetical protein ABI59_11925 [Acidobacteria bacterium Mor1]